MALVVITSAAAAPATAAAGAVVILRCTWHPLQELPGVGAAPRTWGGIQYGIWALNQDRNCNTFSYL